MMDVFEFYVLSKMLVSLSKFFFYLSEKPAENDVFRLGFHRKNETETNRKTEKRQWYNGEIRLQTNVADELMAHLFRKQ